MSASLLTTLQHKRTHKCEGYEIAAIRLRYLKLTAETLEQGVK